MVVFVTGANGLVGSFVVKELLALGHQPKLLLRKNADIKLLENEMHHCLTIEGDILDTILLVSAMETCDAVIHCAGKVSFDPRKKKEIFDANVQGTANVVNGCLKTGIKKLIHVSSIAALGRQQDESTMDEKTKWVDSGLNSFYAKSKYLAELEVYRAGEEGLDYSIVNPSIVIGPGDFHRSSTKLLSFIKNMPWCYPEGYLNVVDVRDVAKTICGLLLIQHRERLVLNSECISYKHFYSMVLKANGITLQPFRLPNSFIHLVAFFDSIRTFFAGGEPLVTKETTRFLHKKFAYKSLYYDKLFYNSYFSAQESITWTINKMKRL